MKGKNRPGRGFTPTRRQRKGNFNGGRRESESLIARGGYFGIEKRKSGYFVTICSRQKALPGYRDRNQGKAGLPLEVLTKKGPFSTEGGTSHF